MSEIRAEIVNQFCEILEKEDWEPEEEAVGKIVDTSLRNKEGLREMLSRHPKWDANTMRITMPVETNGERIDVPEKMDGLRLGTGRSVRLVRRRSDVLRVLSGMTG